jgi:hypothetical protein
MSRVYFLEGGDEMVRRRARLARGAVVEAWPDLHVGRGAFWVGEEGKALLDGAGEPMPARLWLPAERVPIFYGPRVCDLDSLPREESLRARVLSVGGIAVAWVTLDRDGERLAYEPASPVDPIFHLRRPGGAAAHLWRLFRTRDDAIAAMVEAWGADSEGADWARALTVRDFDDLLRQHATRG